MRGKWIFGAASAAILATMGLSSASAQTGAADPAGDASTRARIAPGQTIAGDLSPGGDTDWFRISMRTGQLYKIALNASSEGEGALDPLVRIVDAHGTEVARNDDGREGLNSYLEFTPARSGDFFIEARGFADEATGGYSLNVEAVRLPPDPAAASTSTHASIAVGQTLTGGLEYGGDKDWYRIRLTQGQSYRFMLNGDEGEGGLADPVLRIHDASGAEVATDDDNGEGLNSYLEFTAPTTGVYYVDAGGFVDDATGTYKLSAQAGDIPADNTTDAALAADGDSREGTLSPGGDSDWYRVHLDAGQSMRVGLDGGDGEGMLADPLLVLHGPDGATISQDDDGGDGLNSWLEFIAPSAGDYFLEARGFGEDATGKYTISLTAGEIPGVADGAESLTANGEGRNSTIQPDGDKDWFSIEMIEGRPYRFNVTGGSDGALADPMLTLFDSEGHQVATDDDGGSGANSYLQFVSPTGGTYYAQVSSFGDTGTGSYHIGVSDTEVPGSTNTDEELAADDGDERGSSIDFVGDLDSYRVQLTAGIRYVINVSGDGEHPLTDPFLTVMNSEGTSITTDDDSGTGLDARLTFVPQSTDTFYLQASGLGGSTGGYKISIARQDENRH